MFPCHSDFPQLLGGDRELGDRELGGERDLGERDLGERDLGERELGNRKLLFTDLEPAERNIIMVRVSI